MRKIAYPNADAAGGISIVFPTGEVPLSAVIEKDIPSGIPFRFFEAEDLPQTDEDREAWEVDFSNPDGYGGALPAGS